MAISITTIKLLYLPKLTDSTLDATLTALVNVVVTRAIDYIDDADITEEDDLPDVVADAVMKQVAFEFARRQSLGLAAVTAPDGTQSVFTNDNWLPDVLMTLNRYKTFALGQEEDTTT